MPQGFSSQAIPHAKQIATKVWTSQMDFTTTETGAKDLNRKARFVVANQQTAPIYDRYEGLFPVPTLDDFFPAQGATTVVNITWLPNNLYPLSPPSLVFLQSKRKTDHACPLVVKEKSDRGREKSLTRQTD